LEWQKNFASKVVGFHMQGCKRCFPRGVGVGTNLHFAVRALLLEKQRHIIDGIWKTEKFSISWAFEMDKVQKGQL
jgi:hypothetical protein